MHCKFCDLEVSVVCIAGSRMLCEKFKEKFGNFSIKKESSKPVDNDKEDNFFIPLKTPEQVEKEERERQEIAETFIGFLKEINSKKKNSFADD